MNLGNCLKCQQKLAVIQRNKHRMTGDNKVLLDVDGKELRQDAKEHLTGKPALEWVVACSDCGREAREHPYQKSLDEAAAKARTAPPPTPPAFNKTQYTELNGFDVVERRLTALEAALTLVTSRMEKEIAEAHGRIDALQETLAAAMAGKRGRAKAEPAPLAVASEPTTDSGERTHD